ncbi:MAG: glycosyltransferase family 4 protein [Lachnospiraceae bacterium]|nr:glycosyltransferase family 4 protein [Lachnospiraceae bacterium]
MKILIVRTFPNIINSNNYNVQEIGLAKALTMAGVQTDVVLYNGSDNDYTELIELDDDVYISVYHLRGFGILKNGFFPSLRGLTSGYDVIQVHEYDQLTSWWYYTGRDRDKVVIYHGPYYHDFNKGYNLKCRVFDRIFLKLRHNPDVIAFTKSRAAAGFLEDKGFRNTYPVGVGLDYDAFEGVDTEPMRGSGFTWIYVGKIEPRRNSIMLMKLVDRLLTDHGDMKMILVGDGDKAYKDEALAPVRKWIASGRMAYYPKLNQTEVGELYRQADCMLFPSNYEIFGMVLMEAMYFGLPVISSNNGGADMLIRNGENGIIVDSFELDDWTEACENIYNDVGLRESIGKKLKNEQYSLGWEVVADKMLEVYRSRGFLK